MLKRLLLVAPLLTCLCLADDEDDAIRAANLDFVNRWHSLNVEASNDNPHLTVLPRVLVDTAAMTVTFQAEATGIGDRDPVEFFLIGEQSGNAYEAIAVALAEPRHIGAGLRLLGLPEGRGADPAETRFWPKGERVIMTFNGRRVEELLLDSRTGKPLPSRGLVHIGSRLIPSADGSSLELAAQARAPFSIASNYNEPDTLLDVPWQAPQSAVYSHQARNPAFRFGAGERIEVVITPEYKDGRRRVQDLLLTLSAPTGATGLGDARFRLENTTAGTVILEDAAIDRLSAAFADMIAGGQDPFTELHIAGETPLRIARDTASLLRAIDTENGIRIEPPPAGALFYQAFTPNEQFRRREDRFMHPWELHFAADGEAVLTRIDEHWTRGEPRPDITTEDIPVSGAQDLVAVLATQNTDVRGIFVFAPPEVTVGGIMRLLQPALKTHPHIHIYLREDVQKEPAPEAGDNP